MVQLSCSYLHRNMETRQRKPSRLTQLVTPIVNITRKLSRREKSDAADDLSSDVVDVGKIGTEVSDEFLSEMREVFREFDKDKSGFICTREMGPLLRAMGNNPTHDEVLHQFLKLKGLSSYPSPQVNHLMARADVDHNGKLDLTEFTLMMYNYRMETRDKDLEEFKRREEIMQAFR